ncbi:MAG: redoxin domain-containing protein [Sideroxydans sp.]|nr:redoxin domain-containing protein [Sideroxydans sp.]
MARHIHALRATTLIAALLLTSAFSPAARADDWSLLASNGIRYSLAGLHGKWVLVNFWAPWCPPCLEEIPEFVKLQKRRDDLQVIGVAVMYRNRQNVADVVRDKAISYPVVFGNEDIASDFGGLVGLPTSLLYSPSGKLLGRHEGPLTQDQVEQAMSGNPAAFTL